MWETGLHKLPVSKRELLLPLDDLCKDILQGIYLRIIMGRVYNNRCNKRRKYIVYSTSLSTAEAAPACFIIVVATS